MMPSINTKRLLLRPIQNDDFDFICQMLQDIDVMYAWEHTFTNDQVKSWIDSKISNYQKYGYDYFLAIDKKSGDVVGQIGLLHENINGEDFIGIGYILNKNCWGKGYATEGARALLNYAFTHLGAKLVLCDIRPENTSSIAVAKRIGMKKTGEFVKQYNNKDMLHELYQISSREFKEML